MLGGRGTFHTVGMEVPVDKATHGVWTGVWGEKPWGLILPSFCLRAAHHGTLPYQ